jgi:hypothetical protein
MPGVAFDYSGQRYNLLPQLDPTTVKRLPGQNFTQEITAIACDSVISTGKLAVPATQANFANAAYGCSVAFAEDRRAFSCDLLQEDSA